MHIARYRIADEKGAYMPRSPAVQALALGADHASAAVYNIRAPVYEHLRAGEEVEYDGVPGPHLEPLNDPARDAVAAYWKANPHATLDPTRKMPLGQDPMGGRSVEQLVTSLLEAMDQDRGRGDASGGSAELAALLAGQKAMQEAMQALTAALTASLVPPSPKAGRAA